MLLSRGLAAPVAPVEAAVVEPSVINVTTTLDFEDIPTGTFAFSSATVDGVNFSVPSGQAIFGSAANNDPFPTKAIELWTFGPSGLTITFPFAVSYLSFDVGETTPIQTPATDQFSATDLTPFNFTLSHTTLETISVDLPSPQSTVQILFQSGTESLLGMDNLTFSNVPEPTGLELLAFISATAATRRRRGKAICEPVFPLVTPA